MKLSVVAGRASTGKRPPKPVPDHIREQAAQMFLAIGAVESLMGTWGLKWSDLAAAFAPQQPLPLEPSPPSAPAPETAKPSWIERDKMIAVVEAIEKAAQPSATSEFGRGFLTTFRQ